MNTDAMTRLVDQQLSLLELGQRLNIGSEARCRRGISRTIFYKHKQRFGEQGLEEMKDLLPLPKSHPSPRPLR